MTPAEQAILFGIGRDPMQLGFGGPGFFSPQMLLQRPALPQPPVLTQVLTDPAQLSLLNPGGTPSAAGMRTAPAPTSAPLRQPVNMVRQVNQAAGAAANTRASAANATSAAQRITSMGRVAPPNAAAAAQALGIPAGPFVGPMPQQAQAPSAVPMLSPQTRQALQALSSIPGAGRLASTGLGAVLLGNLMQQQADANAPSAPIQSAVPAPIDAAGLAAMGAGPVAPQAQPAPVPAQARAVQPAAQPRSATPRAQAQPRAGTRATPAPASSIRDGLNVGIDDATRARAYAALGIIPMPADLLDQSAIRNVQ